MKKTPVNIALVIFTLAAVILSGCSSGKEESCTKKDTAFSMTLEDAIGIAEKSACMDDGTLNSDVMCNDFTGTWWIGLDPKEEHPGCNPACVVDVETKTAETNWRCTGLIA